MPFALDRTPVSPSARQLAAARALLTTLCLRDANLPARARACVGAQQLAGTTAVDKNLLDNMMVFRKSVSLIFITEDATGRTHGVANVTHGGTIVFEQAAAGACTVEYVPRSVWAPPHPPALHALLEAGAHRDAGVCACHMFRLRRHFAFRYDIDPITYQRTAIPDKACVSTPDKRTKDWYAPPVLIPRRLHPTRRVRR